MKSFSTEETKELSVDDISGRKSTGRIITKRQKKGKPLSTQDIERLDSARLSDIERESRGKKGQEIKKNVIKTKGQEDLLNRIQPQRPVKKGEKFYGKPSSVDVSTGKAKYVPPKEIQGRSDYIDPKTNKASEKGIKKYISKARQMRTGSNIPVDSKTTDSIAKIAKSEYTDKINQKYGGRRARRAYSNAPSLADVQKQVDLKDRLKQKYGKGEYRKGFKKTQGVNQADVSKKIASDTKAYNQKRTSSTFKDFSKEIGKRKSQGTTKFDAVNRAYDIWDDGDIGNPSSTQTPTKPKNPIKKSKVTTAKLGNQQWQGPQTPGRRGHLEVVPDIKKPPKEIKIDGKYKGPKFDTGSKIKITNPPTPPKSNFTSNTTGKLSDTAWRDNTKKGLKPSKTFKQFASKFPKPVRSFAKGSGRLLGKAVGPAFAVADGIGNYKGYKKQGYNTSGAIARSGAKTGAYWGGWAAGAKGGAALGATIGSVVPGVGTAIGGAVGGVLGGFAGGHLAGKTADWAIKSYDTTFGKQKLKDIKAKNIAKMNAKALKADPWKAYKTQPKVSNNRIATNKGNLRTITLKKGKDGTYIMPRGFTAGGTVNRTTQLATKTG